MFNRLFQKDKKPNAPVIRSVVGSTTEQLATLIPFANAPETTKITGFNFAELLEMGHKDKLFEVGQNDEWDYYLLEGQLALVASDGREALLDSDSPKSKNPIAYLRPRKFSAEVRSNKATIVRFPHHVLELSFKQSRSGHSWEQEEPILIGELDQTTLLEKIIIEIENDSLQIPTLPEVAERVRQACEDTENSIDSIAKIASNDAAISAKLLAASNSPLYRGVNPTSTLHDAISRLGRTTTQKLVYYYATQELFDTPIALLRQLFQESWQQSLERAVMAQTLAQYSPGDLNPDTAFLCGLLFRIGDLVAYQYTADAEEALDEIEKIKHIAETISAQISRKLIGNWHLPEQVSEALEHGTDWTYCCAGELPDYGELMVVTNIHIRMMNNNMRGLPNLGEIPALTRIVTDEFAPDVSIITLAKTTLKTLTEM